MSLYRFAGILCIKVSAHHMPKTGVFFFSVKLMHIRYHPIVQEIVLSFVPVLGLRDELGRSANLDPLMPLLMPSLGQQSNVVIPCPQVAKVLHPKSRCYV